MGSKCCTTTKEKYEVYVAPNNDSISEFAYSSRATGRIHRIRAMSINTKKSLTTGEGFMESPPDETEGENGVLLNLLSSVPHYPTNFKIEPFHFRREGRKESLDNRYVVCEVIGKGSFGIVKKVKDELAGSYKALKIISKANCQKTDNSADEIEIIKKLVF